MIIVKRTLTEPKTALAGVMLETSFARFMASMATFNEETAPPLRFCLLELASMVETRGSGGKTEMWRPFRRDVPRSRWTKQVTEVF